MATLWKAPGPRLKTVVITVQQTHRTWSPLNLKPGNSLWSLVKRNRSKVRPNNTEFIVILSGLFLAANVKSGQKKTEVGLEYLKQEVEFWMLALWFIETKLELVDTWCYFCFVIEGTVQHVVGSMMHLGWFASSVPVSIVHVHSSRRKKSFVYLTNNGKKCEEC